MIWIAAFICFASAGCHYYLNNYKWMNVGFLASFVWGVVLLINAITPYDWFPFSIKGEIYIFVGTVSLCLGLIHRRSFLSLSNYNPASDKTVVLEISKGAVVNTFFIIQFFLVLAMIPMVIKAGRALVSSGFNLFLVRYLYTNGTAENALMNTFERLFYIHYIVGPCSQACIIIDAILCIENSFWKKPFIYLLLLMTLQTVYTAGRTIIFFGSFCLFFSFFYFRQFHRGDYSMKIVYKKLKRFLAVFLLFVGIITIMRNRASSGFLGNIFHTFIVYFCGGTRVFDKILQNPSTYGLDHYSIFTCSFAGFLAVISIIQTYTFGRIGIHIIPSSFSPYYNAQGYVSSSITYGTSSAMNAFPTMFYYFCRDGGIVAMVLFVILFARILLYQEKKFSIDRNLYSGFKYFLLLYVVIMSVCWWEPMRQEFWMTLFWGWVICKLIIERNLSIKT